MRCLALLVLGMGLVSPLKGQGIRYEVGRKLRQFEGTVETHLNPKARQRVVSPLKSATFAFFTARLGEVARQLDRARHLLGSEKAPAKEVRWADSLVVHPAGRLLDVSTPTLAFTVEHLYRVSVKKPDQAQLRCTLQRRGRKPGLSVTYSLVALPQKATMPLRGIVPGDYLFRCEVLVKGKALASSEQTLSFATRLSERMQKLRQGARNLPEKPRTTTRESLRQLVDLLTDLEQKKTGETDYPAARLLSEAEALLQAAHTNKEFYGPTRPGQYWLRVPTNSQTTSLRIQVPKVARKGKPMPLVVALHGTGGSENLFFDGYGAGKITKLCERRGWLLVSPRGGLKPGLIATLTRLYPVDSKRIFLIGHSLGAAQALAIVGRNPTQFAAVAALGGGGGTRKSEALKGVPFFVGIGTEDFALRAARALKNRLQTSGVRTLRYREYPQIEHLLIVQLALDDVFSFFDKVSREKQEKTHTSKRARTRQQRTRDWQEKP